MWYLDTDNVIRIVGLRNVVTGAYVNNATVTGILYKLPAISPDAAAVVNKGDATTVGIPCTGHGLSEGDTVRLERFQNYNGIFDLHADTTVNELVITAVYAAEVLTGEEFIYCAIVGTTSVPITFSFEFGSNGNYVGKFPYTTPLLQGESYMMCIKEVSGTEQVLAKIIYEAGFQGM